MVLCLIILFMVGACWGSFLNVVGHRLIIGGNFVSGRSRCPSCHRTLRWYELIPLFSWIALKARCATCASRISALYPCIELAMAILLPAIVLYRPDQIISAFLFVSALLVSIRTDCEHMLISRYATLFLLPLCWAASYFGLLPIALSESLIGALLGYAVLAGVRALFLAITGREGLGIGDAELLAFIGAFTGPIGCWLSLTFGSVIGAVTGLTWMLCTRSTLQTRIPFGPFLALGAILVVLAGPRITACVFSF